MKKYPPIVDIATLEKAVKVLKRKHGCLTAYPSMRQDGTWVNRGTSYLSRTLVISYFNSIGSNAGAMEINEHRFETLAEMYCFVCKIITRLTREQWSEKKRNEVH